MSFVLQRLPPARVGGVFLGRGRGFEALWGHQPFGKHVASPGLAEQGALQVRITFLETFSSSDVGCELQYSQAVFHSEYLYVCNSKASWFSLSIYKIL